MRRALVLALALAGCVPGGSVGAGVGGGVGGGGGGGGGGVPASAGGDLVVPDLVGKTLDEAQAIAHQAGFTQEVETSRPVECGDGAARDPGKINCQDPDAGTTVKPYTLIAVNVYQPTVFVGSIVRAQIEPLVGLSIDQAKAGLAKLGFKGQVEIHPANHYIQSCKLDTVCAIEPEAGFPLDATIGFTVNKKISISAPPP